MVTKETMRKELIKMATEIINIETTRLTHEEIRETFSYTKRMLKSLKQDVLHEKDEVKE